MSRILQGYDCKITSGYGNRIINGTNQWHSGVDVVGNNNGASVVCPIIAHTGGTVVECVKNVSGFISGSYGNKIRIRHTDKQETFYAHLKEGSVTVGVGSKVNKGDVIGFMGNTGESYGAHLHFEYILDGKPVDPTAYLNTDLPNLSGGAVNVSYAVRTIKSGWLPFVKNLEDFAGVGGQQITDIAVKVDKGSIWYQVHIKGGGWLDPVSGCDINNLQSGYAGNGQPIDAVVVYYTTPSGETIKKAKYRVAPVGANYYSWQYDNEKGSGMDGYAGAFGTGLDRLQIVIE